MIAAEPGFFDGVQIFALNTVDCAYKSYILGQSFGVFQIQLVDFCGAVRSIASVRKKWALTVKIATMADADSRFPGQSGSGFYAAGSIGAILGGVAATIAATIKNGTRKTATAAQIVILSSAEPNHSNWSHARSPGTPASRPPLLY